MNQRDAKPSELKFKISSAIALGVFLILAAGSVGFIFPNSNRFIVDAVGTHYPAIAPWLRAQDFTTTHLLMSVTATYLVFFLIKFLSKLLSKWGVNSLARKIKEFFSPPQQPHSTSKLSLLKDKLFPDTAYSKTDIPFYGREDELAWLHLQCQQASDKGGLTAIALWGQQGIGKTHLGYRFAKSMTDGAYAGCTNWQAHTLDKTFNSQQLLGSLTKPTLLIWDDVSLNEDTSKTQLQQLRRACTGRPKPLVLLLTSWHSREGEGLTLDQKLIDTERECKSLPKEFANQIYPQASALSPDMQGHPLFLRLLQEQSRGQNPLADASHKTLWQLCEQWAVGYIQRLQNEHHISPEALAALAVVSCSKSASLGELIANFSLTPADQDTLKKTGRISNHQGDLRLSPVRPDLLGWAFALKQLQGSEPAKLALWAKLAWRLDFFDTGRFLQASVINNLSQHPWAKALHNPIFAPIDFQEALSRTKAATNAVDHYGRQGKLTEMADEIAVTQNIALRFKDNTEIQLSRTVAATNAVGHYSARSKLTEMTDEIAVAKDIAQRFKDNADIQLSRAEAATNAVAHYGTHGMLTEMAVEIAVAQDIAQRFKDNAEIQLVRAKAATNAVCDYGKQGLLPEMATEIAIAQDIAQRFKDNAEIQLERAMTATNAVGPYGMHLMLTEVTAEITMAQDIAQLFKDNAEIQLERSKAANNAVGYYCTHNMLTEMAAEIAVAQDIAQRFIDNAEIQLRYARCLLIKTKFAIQAGLAPDIAFVDLVQCVKSRPYLRDMPPFNTPELGQILDGKTS
jgi:hypothetical protein